MRTRRAGIAVLLCVLVGLAAISERPVVAEVDSKEVVLFREDFEVDVGKVDYATNSKEYDVLASGVSEEQHSQGRRSYTLDVVYQHGDYFDAELVLPERIPVTPETSAAGWIRGERGEAAIGAKCLLKSPLSGAKDLVVHVVWPLDDEKAGANKWARAQRGAGDFQADVVTLMVKALEEYDVAPRYATFYLHCRPPAIERLYLRVGGPPGKHYTAYVDNIEIRGSTEKVESSARYQEKAAAMTTLLRRDLENAKGRLDTVPRGGLVDDVEQIGELSYELRTLKKRLAETPPSLREWIHLAGEVTVVVSMVNGFVERFGK